MRSLRLAFGIALAFVLGGASVAFGATPAPGTLAAYADRVDRAHAVAERALPKMADERTAHDVAAQVNTLLPAVENVRVGDNVVRVDNSIVRSLVASLDSAVRRGKRHDAGVQLERHLASLRLAVGDGELTPLPSDRAALDRLVERAGPTEDPFAKLMADVVERIGEWLSDRFDAVASRPGAGLAFRVTLYVILALLVALVAWTGLRVWRSMRLAMAAREREHVERLQPVPVVPAAEGLPPDILRYADSLAREGRFREAVRALFGGAALALVERGVVSQTRTRTNRELLGEVKPAAPQAEAPLRDLCRAFEWAWYGHVDPGESGFSAAREMYGAVLRAVPKGESA